MPQEGPMLFLTVVAWMLATPILLFMLYLAWRKLGPHGWRKRRRRRVRRHREY
jgi:hypothetical protein